MQRIKYRKGEPRGEIEMLTQTVERQELQRVIDTLPDNNVAAALDFIRGLQPDTDDGYLPHIPNVETAAAIREGRAGNVKSAATLEEFFAEMRKDDEDD